MPVGGAPRDMATIFFRRLLLTVFDGILHNSSTSPFAGVCRSWLETSPGPFERVPEGSVVVVSGRSLQGAITMAKKKKAAKKKVAKKKKGHK